MKRLVFLVVGATLLMTIGASLEPASATCVSPRGITTGFSYIFTPGYESLGGFQNSSVSANLIGSFWAIGAGNLDQLGAGIDNGAFAALGGWVSVFPGYPVLINSTWAAHDEIDGCIDAGPEPLCMAILLMDLDTNGTGAFALATDAVDTFFDYNFEQPGFAPINLVSVPGMSITGSVRTGNGTGVDVTVGGLALSAIQNGLYLDPACPQPTGGPGSVIQGYQVYSRETPRGAPAPTDMAVEGWVPVGPVTPLGTPSTVSLTCTGDTDQYLAAGVIFDSATRSRFLSRSSTRFECGANLADPVDVIERKPRNREVPRSPSRGR